MHAGEKHREKHRRTNYGRSDTAVRCQEFVTGWEITIWFPTAVH